MRADSCHYVIIGSHVEKDRSMQCTVGNERENMPHGCYVPIQNWVPLVANFVRNNQFYNFNNQFLQITNLQFAVTSKNQVLVIYNNRFS